MVYNNIITILLPVTWAKRAKMVKWTNRDKNIPVVLQS